MGGSGLRQFGAARATSLVVAVLLVAVVVVGGAWWVRRDDGSTPVIRDDTSVAPGTALPDGLRVEPGSRVVAAVFATGVSPADDAGAAALRERGHDATPRLYWHAPLVLDGSPSDVFDRYVAQFEAAGYKSRGGKLQAGECGLRDDDKDLLCWSGYRDGDRITAPSVAVWIRGRNGLLDAASVAVDVGAGDLPMARHRQDGAGERIVSIPNHGFLPLPKRASLVHGPIENLPPGLRTDIRFVIASRVMRQQ